MKSHRLGGSKSPRYEVRLHRKAEAEFLRLPANVQDRFEAAIDRLEADPFRKRPGADIRALEGTTGLYRLRVGSYRALYTVEPDGRIVIVLLFDERELGYTRLIPKAEARLAARE
ncbi:MAG TPA: type II toxin-antitoxin system RelE/ParE family toxin [Candidatus Thermoplasmatota archaeon]|nr:type II toxin-antitoxin system RelE/ParE family toxin [Candidatus Thermoplasmatota archaeon]